jgi:D-serine dehydratase
VLCHAEQLALDAGLLAPGGDTALLADAPARALFARHRVLVGSTGNLGYSVGVMARALGLGVEVHMSHDAQAWKKDRLRAVGATVVEHAGDYAQAVAGARALAAADPAAYFIDDEDSLLLFLGYAAAAWDLAPQLAAQGLVPTPARPLRVYLPCGVGGAPGGVAFGLKCLWGDAVQVVFVEPVAAPCFLLRLATGDDAASVYDIGLSNRTVADGLAVPRASARVAALAGPLVDAVVTVSDADLLRMLRFQHEAHGLQLEPSAAAGFVAHEMLAGPCAEAVAAWCPAPVIPLVWTTGGQGLPGRSSRPCWPADLLWVKPLKPERGGPTTNGTSGTTIAPGGGVRSSHHNRTMKTHVVTGSSPAVAVERLAACLPPQTAPRLVFAFYGEAADDEGCTSGWPSAGPACPCWAAARPAA